MPEMRDPSTLDRVPDRGGRLRTAADGARPGTVGPIGRAEVSAARAVLDEYKRGKANLDARIIDNEQWYKLRHWEQIRSKGTRRLRDGTEVPVNNDPEPASAWLFNSLANKHADAMDNYPEPAVLPRERDDQQDAKVLSSVLPVVLEQNYFERVYSDLWWYKLKAGTGVYGVVWDPQKGGTGDVDIRTLDLLNLYWEPGVTDVQKSRNLFHVELVDEDLLRESYPELAGKTLSNDFDVPQYLYDDTVDTSKKAAVIDWYYKRNIGGKDVLHFCKFVSDVVLYASENDPVYADRGFYDHGRYPVVFDPLFPEAGTPAGFGYIDVCKDPQIYIDKLDSVILKHAVMGARPRFFIRGDGSVNEEEYADWQKDFVHYYGSGDPRDSVMAIEVPALSGTYVDVKTLKVDELKETSGNRDFSQGSTTSGVTAASAIAALQEAGSKLSRDMIKASYRAFREVCTLCIELMRQFYSETRYFRVIGHRGELEFVQFSGRQIAAKPMPVVTGDPGYRVPIFDISVKAQKSSPFSTVAQNERAKELYGLGFFRPDLADQALAALDMMQFEGIEQVRERIAQNGTMYQQLMQLQQQMQKLAMIVDAQNGTTILPGLQAEGAAQQHSGEASPSALAVTAAMPRTTQEAEARTQAARQATPQ